MQLRSLFIATALIFATSATLAAPSKGGGFKCWTNKDGVRECGNEVPAEYAQGETRILNRQGRTTEVEERAKTAAEAEAERQKEAARQPEQTNTQPDPQANTLNKEQQAYDRVLLASYLSEADIDAARNRKISAIDAAINYNNGVITKLEEKLKKEQDKADAKKKGGKEPSDDEKKDMELLQKQLDDKKTFIAAKQKEKEETNLEYDGYLHRFRELKASKQAR